VQTGLDIDSVSLPTILVVQISIRSGVCVCSGTMTLLHGYAILAQRHFLIPRLHDTTGRVYRVNKHPTGCQSDFTTGLTTVLNEQLFDQPVMKPGCTTGYGYHTLLLAKT